MEVTTHRGIYEFFTNHTVIGLLDRDDYRQEQAARLTLLRYEEATDGFLPIAWGDAFSGVEPRTVEDRKNSVFYGFGRCLSEVGHCAVTDIDIAGGSSGT